MNTIIPGNADEAEKPEFKPGQKAYYFDFDNSVMECTVNNFDDHEIFVTTIEGHPVGWFTYETLFHSVKEALQSNASLPLPKGIPQ